MLDPDPHKMNADPQPWFLCNRVDRHKWKLFFCLDFTLKYVSESEDSDEEEKEGERREEERRKLAAAHHQRINQLLEVPPGIDLFKRKNNKKLGFSYFTFQDLSLEEDFGYAR